MAEEGGFKFSCPFCTQRIRAYLEHVGEVVSCPGCKEEITVPNPDTGIRKLNRTSDGMCGFTGEEWQVLEGEDYEAVEKIISLPRDRWWECGAAAELMLVRLKLLEDAAGHFQQAFYHAGTRDEHQAFAHYVEQQTRTFVDIVNYSSHVLTLELQEAVGQSNLLPVVKFADRAGREIHRLRTFHLDLFEHSLPEENPCPAIHQIMTSWAPHVLQGFNQAVSQLRLLAAGPRDPDAEVYLNISLVPPSLQQHFMFFNDFKAELNAGAAARRA